MYGLVTVADATSYKLGTVSTNFLSNKVENENPLHQFDDKSYKSKSNETKQSQRKQSHRDPF